MENNVLILLAIAILPIYILGSYIYHRDKNKEPKKLILSIFFGGMGSCIITLILTTILQVIAPFFASDVYKLNIPEKILYVYVGIALIEEFSKWLVSYKISFNSKEFDESFDAVIYCGFAALGFAIFENVLYVLQNGFATGLLRAVTAVPGHLCFGVAMGYYFALAKNAQVKGQKSSKTSYLLYSILVPTILHGTYDFLVFSQIEAFYKVFYLFTGVLIIGTFIWIIRLSKKNDLFIPPVFQSFADRFGAIPCPKCGEKSSGNFCPKCGTKIK